MKSNELNKFFRVEKIDPRNDCWRYGTSQNIRGEDHQDHKLLSGHLQNF